jgi:glucose/arabinose dehydrogenase
MARADLLSINSEGLMWMSLRLMQPALFLVLAACGASKSANADAPAADPPFQVAPVATFSSPWALAFLPGSHDALVTEKPGHIWLVDTSNGRKQPVSGAPKVVESDQGGLLDVVASPTFATDHAVYLTYAEPSAHGGSGLALARAQLTRSGSGGALSGLQVLWHDPSGGEGGQFGGIVAFAPDGRSLFLSSGERQRFIPAQDPNQPLGKILHLTLDG